MQRVLWRMEALQSENVYVTMALQVMLFVSVCLNAPKAASTVNVFLLVTVTVILDLQEKIVHSAIQIWQIILGTYP